MVKFLIVDGNSIANRAFYALPFLTNHEGKASGAVFGFANILIKLISQEKPSHVAVAFDHARKTFRNEIYADYKGQRKPTPPELTSQFPLIKEMLQCMNIQTFEFEGIEADDIIGSISKNCEGNKILLSGDRDLLQLIDSSTSVWLTKKGVTEIEKVTPDNLESVYGVKTPSQVIDLKGLMGDSSDNIPGVKGVGEKTAHSLIGTYGDIDGVYKNIEEITGKLKEKLLDGKEEAYMSKTLATIKTDCDFKFDMEKCKLQFPFPVKTSEFFKNMDFVSLLKNNNIYSEEVTSEDEVKAERVELTASVLDKLIKLKPEKFAYNLKNMTFSDGTSKVYYLNSNYDMFGSSLSLQDVCNKLKPIFEDREVVKLTLSAKDDLHLLGKYQIGLNNYFDLTLARYIANAGLKTSELVADVNTYFTLASNLEKQLEREGTIHIYKDIELPLVEILFKMEEDGFAINFEKVEELNEQFSSQIEKLSADIYAEAGEEFNINSPKQVAYILFDKLGIKTYNNKKQSTSIDVLGEIRYIPIVDKILQHRKVTKLKNTYIDVYMEICKNNGNIIHTTFNQALTSTGRLSSSEPNLQTIPTRDEEGRELRKIFISKFKGGSLISADYNQIELRLLADMSGEEHLINAYKEGKDIHTITASQIFGKSEGAVTASERREAKAVNFGIIYGISDYGLSQNIKSSRAKAKAYIDSYFDRYPKVKGFMNDNVAKATADGFIKTKFGRIRKIPEINSSKFQTRSFGQRVAMNMPLQGTASDIIKLAMIKVYNALKPFKSQLILQIHDELIVDTYPGEEEKVAKILKEEMENVTKLQVPLITTVGSGKNLYDCK